jgi:signal transduction histidine kinase
MVQECLTNVVRHAEASEADVGVSAANELTLSVRDNGRGPRTDPNDRSERYGLVGMRERAEGLGGSFQWYGDSRHGERGVRVVVSLPLAAEKAR